MGEIALALMDARSLFQGFLVLRYLKFLKEYRRRKNIMKIARRQVETEILKVYGSPPSSPPCYRRETIFVTLFAYQEEEVFPKRGLLLKKRICSDESKFFPL